jgi:hypothetical protein
VGRESLFRRRLYCSSTGRSGGRGDDNSRRDGPVGRDRSAWTRSRRDPPRDPRTLHLPAQLHTRPVTKQGERCRLIKFETQRHPLARSSIQNPILILPASTFLSRQWEGSNFSAQPCTPETAWLQVCPSVPFLPSPAVLCPPNNTYQCASASAATKARGNPV